MHTLARPLQGEVLRGCRHWLLPIFIEKTSPDDLFGKREARRLPRLCPGRDLQHGPIPEAWKEQVVERGEFLLVECVAAINYKVAVLRSRERARAYERRRVVPRGVALAREAQLFSSP